MTTLSNGLRVASENRFGQFCTVGIVIDSGPRYEVAYPSGISHIIEKLAFNSTIQYPEKEWILRELERHGGICDCQSSRDTFIYAASADSRGLDKVTAVLAEVVMRPKLKQEEIENARQAVLFELESLHMRPEQEPILMDMIHAAAYRDNSLGFPKLCSAENASKIDRKMLLNFLKHHHTPTRMVVAGVGVNHDVFVQMVKRHFTESQTTWDMELLGNNGASSVDSSIAQYTGGVRTEECEIPIYASVGLPELCHVVIGLGKKLCLDTLIKMNLLSSFNS